MMMCFYLILSLFLEMIASLIFQSHGSIINNNVKTKKALLFLLVELENHSVEYWTKVEEFD